MGKLKEVVFVWGFIWSLAFLMWTWGIGTRTPFMNVPIPFSMASSLLDLYITCASGMKSTLKKPIAPGREPDRCPAAAMQRFCAHYPLSSDSLILAHRNTLRHSGNRSEVPFSVHTIHTAVVLPFHLSRCGCLKSRSVFHLEIQCPSCGPIGQRSF